MTETITISEDKLRRLESRAQKLAQDKSYLQLLVGLMNRMGEAPGLENTIESLLRHIMDIMGCTNLILYYFIDKSLFYSDVYGKKMQIDSIADDLVRKVFETREPIDIEHDFSDTMMISNEFSKAYTWAYPMLVGADFIGVLKMESTNMSGHELYKEMPPFFNYAALILKNEIQSHSRLRKAYDQLNIKNEELVREIDRRKHAEKELREINETLEDIVVARTIELQKANEKLRLELIEREWAEKEIQRLKNYLANIIDSMPSLLVGIDHNETVIQWNLKAANLTGITAEEAVGKSLRQVLPDFSPWISSLREDLVRHHPTVMEKLLLEKDGERHFHDLMLYPLVSNGVEGMVVRIEDVTERTRIQEFMVQTEKMMSVAGLAAGMAHEINNPLGIILQAARNIDRRISPKLPANQRAAEEIGICLEDIHRYFEKRQIDRFIGSIHESVDRAVRIVSNMLRFSRCAENTMRAESLSEIMEKSVDLASNDYDLKKKYDFRSIELIRDYADIPRIPVVAVEIEQVILNLLKNAAQAMSANPRERKPHILLSICQKDRYAVMTVEDNGPGISEENKRRVFEPFFTTKSPGAGTGLGLSVSYMIMTQNHKGLMEVRSEPGKGTCFTVRLPIHDER